MNWLSAFFFVMFLSQAACATSPFAQGGLFDGKTGQTQALEASLAHVKPGQAVIVSEIHGFEPHHANQRAVLSQLARQGLKVSVGMEFLDFTHQRTVDQFLAGRLEEAEFLATVGWGGTPFDNYREQVLFPRKTGGKTIALNAPRSLSGAISKKGVIGLTNEEAALLPPDFRFGNPAYRERFAATMRGHIPEPAIQRYFEAQSLWDDTMAWKTAEFLRAHPDQVLVIIVGDFHAAWGGGLPDRLRARGVDVHVLSQINADGQSASELNEDVLPHPQWGPRADGVWVEAP